MCARELAFIDLTQRQLASGGDIDDALVRVTIDGDGAVRIEYAPGHGETRLYYAARRGWCSAITWLLEQGADVHARLFIDARVPDDVFAHVLAFWRSARDL
ncbi:SET domain-containing protein [Aureococcus anophagefferens]|nr:SET domain-containing protein [Aureococcus anophagefferens]